MSTLRVVPNVFPEPFAVEWGHDQYGTFQSFAVGNVVQRMRWIPPGSFLMGSPESEADRSDDEVQHLASLTRGYWLGDTPVTQRLWVAVMGTNPSVFEALSHPVENVSWLDCGAFLARLNIHLEAMFGARRELEFRFPTEAEWEYACRSGTTTATWEGDVKNLDSFDAPLLDAIAWYGANSGLSTRDVAQKRANFWGLYDMLGNVFEWCADDYRRQYARTIHDPLVSIGDGARVMRGGSWSSRAGRVRAAVRFAGPSNHRNRNVGFRLAYAPRGPGS